jgi:hypothetical protein
MKPTIGPVDILVYRNRKQRFVARVTLTDPTWTGEPYALPKQLVGTTEHPRTRFMDALQDAYDLMETMAMQAVIVAGMRKENG